NPDATSALTHGGHARSSVSCSNGTSASRQFLSFVLRWRQPPPRNHRNREGNREERRQRARPLPRPQLVRLPLLTPRLHLTWRQHLARRLPRRTSPRRGLPRTSRRHELRHAPRRGSWPGPPAARRPRRWRATRRRRELRLQRSNSRKPRAAMSAAVQRNSPSPLNPARATMWRVHPRRRAQQQRWALRRRALRQQHSPLTPPPTRPSNKMRPRRRSPTGTRKRPPAPAPCRAACCAISPLPTYPPPAIPARAPWRARRSKAG